MNTFYCFVGILILLRLQKIRSAYSPEKETEIRNEEIKIASYDMISRPSAQTVITTKLSILAVDELDLKSQKLTSAGWLSFEWEDGRINWTPSAKDDIEEIFSKPADIWKPELVVDNSFDDVGVISNTDLYLRVKNTGVVEWEPPMSFVTHCTVDITFYPYDQQICSINIISWGFTADEVMLEAADTPVNLDDFEEHGEWEVFSSRAEIANLTESAIDGSGTIRKYPQVAFWLKMKRRSNFYNLNIVMPVFVTSLLVALTFIVPLDSGEKLSYILTVFLALVVLLTIVADSLPPTSISTSVLGLYLGIVTVMAAFGILLTVLILLMYHKDGPSKKSPSGIISLAYIAAFCTCSRKYLRSNKVTPITNKLDDDDETPANVTIYEADWKEIAVIMDKFCFMVFLILTVVMNLSFVVTLTAGGASYEPSN